MTACERIRPLLYRLSEGELAPEEALRLARHVPDCTACRILLARERHLATVLEQGLEDRLAPGEEFVSSVMARLPERVPPARQRRRRNLRLAVLAVLGAGAAAASSAGLPELDLPLRLPVPAAPPAGGDLPALLEGLAGAGAAAASLLEAVAHHLPSLPELASPATLAFAVAAPPALALALASALLAVTARALLR